MSKVVHLDYETRAAIDLTEVGAHRYAIDPTCRILMAAVSADDSEEVLLWVHPEFGGSPENEGALALLRSADLIYAHNAGFEQAVTWGRGMADLGWEPRIDQWRCTAAMARKAGLPSSLEKVGAALGLDQQKDLRGKKLIKLFSIPREDGHFNDPQGELFPSFQQFMEYCRQDVRTEKAVHQRLRAFELQEAPLETFLFDLRLNQRGIPVNTRALGYAQQIIQEVQQKVSMEFRQLTGLNPTQRGKVLELVRSKGLAIPDMQAETLDALTEEQLGAAPEAARVLELYRKLSYAAVKKVGAMLACACPDGRVRGGHLYYGAGTGRWSGRLVQPQNFKKTPAWMKDLTDQIYLAIDRGISAEGLSLVYGEPLEVISGVIRHFIHGEMFDADYNAVEARIICWLAGEERILEMWRNGRDLYRFMASLVYGIPEDRIAKDSEERDMGKRIELGAGFGMGTKKFKLTCEAYGKDCTEDLAERGIEVYRSTHPKVVRYWYYLDDCARKAIASPGIACGPFMVRTLAGMPYLLFKLRSGRSLAYPRPMVEVQPGDERTQITYWGQLPLSTLWGRVKLYGGKLAENETQATAADIMAHGGIEAEKIGYEIFMLVHDQGLALRQPGQTSEAFTDALVSLPAWAAGLPLKVETKLAPYYRK